MVRFIFSVSHLLVLVDFLSALPLLLQLLPLLPIELSEEGLLATVFFH